MTLGMMASDVEQRIDFAAMRKHKQERIQFELQEKDLGAVLCFDPDNVRYATSTTLGEWHRDKFVRWCLIPREGEPILFEIGSAGEVKRTLCPWLQPENVRPGGGWLRGANAAGGTALAAAMSAARIKSALEEYKASDMPVGIDTADLYILGALQEAGLEIVNGWDVMWDARLLKSPDELKIIEMSAALADGCYESVVDKIRPGELVFIDIMSHFLGYGTCYYRTFVTTRATEKQKDLYKKANDWLQASIDVVRPGITTLDIANQWPTAEEMGTK